MKTILLKIGEKEYDALKKKAQVWILFNNEKISQMELSEAIIVEIVRAIECKEKIVKLYKRRLSDAPRHK